MNCHFHFDRFLSLLQANLSYDAAKVLTLLIFNWSKNKTADVFYVNGFMAWINWLHGFGWILICSHQLIHVQGYSVCKQCKIQLLWILYKCCINCIY